MSAFGAELRSGLMLSAKLAVRVGASLQANASRRNERPPVNPVIAHNGSCAVQLAERNLWDSPVPIRVLLHGNVWLEPQDIEKVTTAFELALSKLELPDRHDPLAVVLAKSIIELAKEGERDPDKLCDEAFRILRW